MVEFLGRAATSVYDGTPGQFAEAGGSYQQESES